MYGRNLNVYNTQTIWGIKQTWYFVTGVGGAVRFLVVGAIGKEEWQPRGQFWMEQYLSSLKYRPI